MTRLWNPPVPLYRFQRAATLSGVCAAVRIALGEARAHLARARGAVAAPSGS